MTASRVSEARKAESNGLETSGIGKPWTTMLENRVAARGSNLSASRMRLIRAVLDHPEDTYFLSSRALARHYEVDTATIVRTVQALGYDRFADFTADLRSHFISRITPYTVMKSMTREKRSISEWAPHYWPRRRYRAFSQRPAPDSRFQCWIICFLQQCGERRA